MDPPTIDKTFRVDESRSLTLLRESLVLHGKYITYQRFICRYQIDSLKTLTDCLRSQMTAHPGKMQIDIVAACFLAKVFFKLIQEFPYPIDWQIAPNEGLGPTFINLLI